MWRKGGRDNVAVGSYGGDSSVEVLRCGDCTYVAPGLPNAWDFGASGVCAEELPVRVVEGFILRVCGRHYCRDDWFERLGVKLGNREPCVGFEEGGQGRGILLVEGGGRVVDLLYGVTSAIGIYNY